MMVDGDNEEEAHISPRREFNAFAPIRETVLHVFGVDFLSNKEVLELFADFKPEEVEWLDDSSCNVIFKEEGDPKKVMEALRLSEEPPGEDRWVRSKPLELKSAAAGSKSKRGRQSQKPVLLQLRPSTEADRKDPTHSGHTDSAYYSHVKEQQALRKQVMELRREKKRQRQSRFLDQVAASKGAGAAAGAAGGAAGAAQDGGGSAASTAPAAAAAASTGGLGGSTAGSGAAASSASSALGPLGMRLEQRGFLDPLLFLKAPSGAKAAAPNAGAAAPDAGAAAPTGAGAGAGEDLSSLLRRAEAEYASVPGAGGASAGAAGAGAGGAGGAGGAAGAATGPLTGPLSADPAGAPGRGRPAQRRGTTPGASGRGRGGQRDGTPGRAGGRGVGSFARQRTPGRPEAGADRQQLQQQRGRKRRPVEQEPRAVSEAPAPLRGPRALPSVEEFLATRKVRCQRLNLHRTFRTIIFRHQSDLKKQRLDQQKGTPPAEDAKMVEAEPSKAESAEVADGEEAAKRSAAKSKLEALKGLPPWEQYFKLNNHFVRLGHFVHTVAWEADGRRVLAVVPHPNRVDTRVLARAVQKPEASVKLRKLKDIATETGFPIFVCPPFGHPKDASGRQPVLLVDSSITELKKPLLFDCGSVGLSIQASEFLRATGAACVEGLAKVPPPGQAAAGAKAAAGAALGGAGLAGEAAPSTRPSTPEPAPEPAPVAASPFASTTAPLAAGSPFGATAPSAAASPFASAAPVAGSPFAPTAPSVPGAQVAPAAAASGCGAGGIPADGGALRKEMEVETRPAD